MRRQMSTALILALVLAIAIGVYSALRLTPREEEQSGVEAGSVSGVSVLSITWADGESLSFSKENDTWHWDGDAELPLLQSRITRITDALEPLSAGRTVERQEELSSYGLEEPAWTLEATGTDGTLTVTAGTEVAGNVYIMVNNDSDTLYTLTSSLTSYLEEGLMDWVELYDFPTLSRENLDTLTFTSGGESLVLVKETVETQGEEGETETDYLFHRGDLSGETLTEDQEDDLMSALYSLSYTNCALWKPSQEDLEACGLGGDAAQLTLTWQEDDVTRSLTLLIGGQDGDGSQYAMVEGDLRVGLLPQEVTQGLLALMT